MTPSPDEPADQLGEATASPTTAAPERESRSAEARTSGAARRPASDTAKTAAVKARTARSASTTKAGAAKPTTAASTGAAAAKKGAGNAGGGKTIAAKTTAAKAAAAKAAAAKNAAAKSTAAHAAAKTTAAKTAAAKAAAAKAAEKAAAAEAAEKAAPGDEPTAEATTAAGTAAVETTAVEMAPVETTAVEMAPVKSPRPVRARPSAKRPSGTKKAKSAPRALAAHAAATPVETVTPAPLHDAGGLVGEIVVEAAPRKVTPQAPVADAADVDVERTEVVDAPAPAEHDATAESVEGAVAEPSEEGAVTAEAVAAEASDVDASIPVEVPGAADDAVEDVVPSSADALRVRGLVKTFGEHRAVNGVDLTVPAGSFYGIVGPNGAGKTTTLSIIAGLLRSDEGTVHVAGIDQRAEPLAAKRVMGVLPDRLRTFDRLTGRQLLHYYGLLRGLSPDVIDKRSADLARAFDLGDALSRVVSDYSAGMTKKIMLAGAMIHSPRVLVLDEPFEAVDPVSSGVILDILRAYVAHGGTVILSSHGMDLVERVCSRVAIIVDGDVLAEGTVDEVRAGQTLESRFVELAGSNGEVEGLEWLHTFSD